MYYELMIKNSSSQKGSAHVIIVIILVLALLGALGFIFWQNFLNKDTDDSSTPAATSTGTDKTVTQDEKTKQEYLLVSEWGVKIPESPSSNKIEYTMDSDMTSATFVSSEQKAVGGECGTDAFARYRMVRVRSGQEPSSYMPEGQVNNAEANGNVVTLDGTRYYIISDFSGGDCSGALSEGASMTLAESNANSNLRKSLLALVAS